MAIKKDSYGYGLIDGKNKVLIPFEYDQILKPKNQLIHVIKDLKKGVFDINYKALVPTEYDNIELRNDRYLICQKADGYWIHDPSGKRINEKAYKYIERPTIKPLMCVQKDGRLGAVNKQYRQVIPCEYDSLISKYGLRYFGYKKGKWGALDTAGKIVLPFEYDRIKRDILTDEYHLQKTKVSLLLF